MNVLIDYQRFIFPLNPCCRNYLTSAFFVRQSTCVLLFCWSVNDSCMLETLAEAQVNLLSKCPTLLIFFHCETVLVLSFDLILLCTVGDNGSVSFCFPRCIHSLRIVFFIFTTPTLSTTASAVDRVCLQLRRVYSLTYIGVYILLQCLI